MSFFYLILLCGIFTNSYAQKYFEFRQKFKKCNRYFTKLLKKVNIKKLFYGKYEMKGKA